MKDTDLVSKPLNNPVTIAVSTQFRTQCCKRDWVLSAQCLVDDLACSHSIPRTGAELIVDETTAAGINLAAAATAPKLHAYITYADILVDGTGNKIITAKLSADVKAESTACKTVFKVAGASMSDTGNKCEIMAGALSTVILTLASAKPGHDKAVVGK